jgi:hypothetical protein
MGRRLATLWVGALLLSAPALFAQGDKQPMTYSLVAKGIV